MTTILYHKNKLFGDSRGTVPGSARSKTQCVKCGNKDDRVRDDRVKLHVEFDESCLFRGSRIVAVGLVGSATTSEGLVKLLRAGENLEDYLRMVAITGDRSQSSGGLLVVTTDAVYDVRDKSGYESFEVVEFTRTDTVSVGSGSKAAKAYLLAVDDPFAAMEIAKQVDDSTGGDIRFVDCAQDRPKVTVVESITVPKIRVTTKGTHRIKGKSK